MRGGNEVMRGWSGGRDGVKRGGMRGVREDSWCTGRGITRDLLQCHLELHRHSGSLLWESIRMGHTAQATFHPYPRATHPKHSKTDCPIAVSPPTPHTFTPPANSPYHKTPRHQTRKAWEVAIETINSTPCVAHFY